MKKLSLAKERNFLAGVTGESSSNEWKRVQEEAEILETLVKKLVDAASGQYYEGTKKALPPLKEKIMYIIKYFREENKWLMKDSMY